MKAVRVSLLALFLIASPLSSSIAGDGVWDYDKGGIEKEESHILIIYYSHLQ